MNRFCDTLQLTKHDDIDFLLNKFHSFDSNTRFKYCKFSEEPPHFLDLNLDDNRFSIYRKHTFIAQYTHFEVLCHGSTWIRSLLNRIHGICSPTKLAQEVQFISKIESWNGLLKQSVFSLIKRFNQQRTTDNYKVLVILNFSRCWNISSYRLF